MTPSHCDYQSLASAVDRLDAWIENHHFRGWDPFDALNSKLLRTLSFRSRLLGILWVQLFKRSPINVRWLVGISKDFNPKAIGLFLSSYVRKYRMTGDNRDLKLVHRFADWLQTNTSAGYSGACWGYNFDWPNRGFYAPRGTPTVVNTAFVANAFLDAYALTEKESYLSTARSACDFILKDLNRLEDHTGLCFSYTPLDRRWIYNASILGAAVLARVARATEETGLGSTALRAMSFVMARQKADGEWVYGEGRADQWVDGFHTGFVLVALADIGKYLGEEFERPTVLRGYRYFVDNFVSPNGMPYYYNHSIYPIDSHAGAQAIITFLRFREADSNALELACRVASWMTENMQARDGYFYYQKHRWYTNRVAYMRWSQAWMQLALTMLLVELPDENLD